MPIRKLLLENKCFSCFDSFLQKNILSRRWLSDGSVFFRKGRLCLFLGSLLLSEHGEILACSQCWRLSQAWFWSSFWPPGVKEEGKIVSPHHCATFVLDPPLLLPKAAKTRGWLLKPALILTQDNKYCLKREWERSQHSHYSQIVHHTDCVNHIFNSRGTKVSE